MKKIFNIAVVIIRRAGAYADAKILGKTPYEYLTENICADSRFSVFEYDDETLANGGSIPPETDYTVKLYSDMPLVTKAEIIQIAEGMHKRRLTAVRIGDAHIYRPVQSGEPSELSILRDGFLSCGNPTSFQKIYELLRKKILNNLLSAGVIIPDINSVTIDSCADIKAGTTVMPYTVIRGNTYIGFNNVIESGCIIDA
ncbi:MAG: hypothetical protein LBQ27_01750, partial [Clostridiales bacterium]|nr:hypothetical protein [Clostridiales bacterium]